MGVVWEWGSHYWGSLEFPLIFPFLFFWIPKNVDPKFHNKKRPRLQALFEAPTAFGPGDLRLKASRHQSSILIGFPLFKPSILGVKSPYFWVETPIWWTFFPDCKSWKRPTLYEGHIQIWLKLVFVLSQMGGENFNLKILLEQWHKTLVV